MISQNPFTELEQKYDGIDEHMIKELYSITLSNFQDLPREYQDSIVHFYYESLKEGNIKNSKKQEFAKRIKKLKLFKKK